MSIAASNFSKLNTKIKSFGYGDVELLDGLFKNTYDEVFNYYMNISTDDMLFELRKKAGIKNPENAKSLNNEQGTWFGIGGNVLGQWLQAYARFYDATKDKKAKEKCDELIKGLNEIAKVSPVFFDGLFMYFFEKYLRGLTDIFVYCANAGALKLAANFINEAMKSDIYLNAAKYLGDNGPSNEIEWYTISESIYYFADVAEKEGFDINDVQRYRNFARKFEYKDFWDIFYKKENIFNYTPLSGQNTAYFHAYSHLNSFNCAAYAYSLSGDKYYIDSIKNFYSFMGNTQELATGGFGAHTEWIMPKTAIINAIINYHDSFETQCDSYAVYRLSNFLLGLTANSYYGNWTEKLFYNATIASLDIDEMGHIMYYSDYNTHSSCKFLHNNTWTCCTGTRPLLVNELKRSIYFARENDIYINLFTPSKLTYNGVTVIQETQFPESDIINIKVSADKPFKLCLRKPRWLKEKYSVKVNGKEINAKEKDGWIVISGKFNGDYTVSVRMPLTLSAEKICAFGVGIAAINCGPVTLAAKAEDKKAQIDFSGDISSQFIETAPLTYTLKGDEDIVFYPFYKYLKDEKYSLYFKL